MKRIGIALALPLMFLGTAAFAGGDVEAGKAVFESICTECHYEDDFAGETEADMLELIKGVAGGEVDHKGDLSGLSAEDLANVAAFYASFQ